MLVIGDQEVQNRTVTLRLNSGAQISALQLEEFERLLVAEIRERRLESPWAAQSGEGAESKSNEEVSH
jgi:threonyl-tRNA synthetase